MSSSNSTDDRSDDTREIFREDPPQDSGRRDRRERRKHSDRSEGNDRGDRGEGRDHGDDGHDRGRTPVVDDRLARERFGGLNLGASFYGWLVAVGIFVLLTGIVSAVLAGVDSSYDLQGRIDQLGTGSAGVIAGASLLLLLLIAYFTGGYVAGRMSRYDGKRQGFGVWLIGLLVTAAAAVAGVVFGQRYNVLDRVDLPTAPVSADQATVGGIAIGIAVLLLTLAAAIVGGSVGNRYHHKIDRAVDIR